MRLEASDPTFTDAALIGKMPDSGWTSLDAWWTN